MFNAIKQDRRWEGPRLAVAVFGGLVFLVLAVAGFEVAPDAVQEVLATLALLVVGPMIARGRRLFAELAAGGRRDGLIYALAYRHAVMVGALVFGAGVGRVVSAALHLAGSDARVPVYATFVGSAVLLIALVAWHQIARERETQRIASRNGFS